MRDTSLRTDTVLTYFKLNTYLATLLDYEKFSMDSALSGFQVADSDRFDERVSKIALAVDSTQETIDAACDWGADVLLVHHGLFWGKAVPLKDGMYKKVASLVQGKCALCAIHLPLDAHLSIGNNAQLADLIGLTDIHACALYQGIPIGVGGQYKGSLKELQRRLHCPKPWERYGIDLIAGEQSAYLSAETAAETTAEIAETTKTAPAGVEKYYCSHATYGDEGVKTAIVSGGGIHVTAELRENGYGLYISGDSNHVAWVTAQELGLDLAFIGHYYSEVWGVLALGALLRDKFDGVRCGFIHLPSGC